MPHPGTLFVVSTPIGNLDDLTPRARDVLAQVDVVAAEDTRHSGRLLDHLGLRKLLLSYHDHNEEGRSADLLRRLQAGENVALISDAGTPLISDPGYRVVRAAREAGVSVVPIPGASAVLAALVVSGLPSDRFAFLGFPPAKGAARQAFVRELVHSPVTSVVYESPHRIRALLAELADGLGDGREVVLCRELTKKFETVLTGSASALLEKLEADQDQQRGEMVVLVSGAPAVEPGDEDLEKLGRLLLAELPVSRAARVLAAWSGHKRAELYQRLEQWADSPAGKPPTDRG